MGFMKGRGCMDQVFAARQAFQSIRLMGKMYFRRLWIWRRPIIINYYFKRSAVQVREYAKEES